PTLTARINGQSGLSALAHGDDSILNYGGLFSPQAEDLLNWPVRETEQYGIDGGLVRDRTPRRNHKNIVLFPRETVTPYVAAPAAFGYGIDSGIGRTILGAAKSGRQQLQEGRDGW